MWPEVVPPPVLELPEPEDELDFFEPVLLPECEQPELEQPELLESVQPEVEQPEVEQPEVEQPELLESEQPEVEQPELPELDELVELPELDDEQPEVEQPEPVAVAARADARVRCRDPLGRLGRGPGRHRAEGPDRERTREAAHHDQTSNSPHCRPLLRVPGARGAHRDPGTLAGLGPACLGHGEPPAHPGAGHAGASAVPGTAAAPARSAPRPARRDRTRAARQPSASSHRSMVSGGMNAR